MNHPAEAPSPVGAGRCAAWLWPGGSGAEVGAVASRALALVFLMAWASLGVQVRLLIGERGLLPLWALLADHPDLPLLGFPTVLRFQALATDGVLLAGTVVGGILALLALGGLRPRLCFALSTGLYLSYTVACQTFLAFQWDNLLIECGLLAAFLPATRPAPLVHLLFRVVVFKLYFESGVAKWQSGEGDWQDGSAMAFYYETAPLPTWLAFHAHNLPAAWHTVESWATLALELLLPFAIFGPRRARFVAAAGFTGFQIANVATANYGFFCYLAIALHLFLLDDADVARARRWVRAKLRLPATVRAAPHAPGWRGRRALAIAGAAAWLLVSLFQALVVLGDGRWRAWLAPVRPFSEPLRVVNAYHLFASVTRERIEPEVQALVDGVWRPLHLRHKPGDVNRRPDFVAPHQPRVDFKLWFHGLSHQQRPGYIAVLLHRLCLDRAEVQPLFRERLPRAPGAVRMVYWRYHFTSRAERARTGAWWRRELVDEAPAHECPR